MAIKITFFSNFLHHHQTPFCDVMYSQLGKNFTFVSTERMPQAFLDNGYPDCTNYIYNLNSYIDSSSYIKAIQLGLDSDIVITGAASDIFIQERMKQNKHTFRYSERFFRTWYNQFNPRLLRALFLRHTLYRRKNLYLLCAGAYTAHDSNLILAYPNKKYKWGYFTKVEEIDVKQVISQKSAGRVELLWIARFIPLKHPELAVQLCNELKKKGYSFHLNMIGEGEMLVPIKKLIMKLNLQNYIDILPRMPNTEIHTVLKKTNIFLFTSNRREGWGAVLIEAMSNGCAVVASHVIGSVPFLINHQENGLIYTSGSLQSLLHQTEKLITNMALRNELGMNAYYTIYNEWSPEIAAFNFLKLSKSFLDNRSCIIDSGPCSKA